MKTSKQNIIDISSNIKKPKKGEALHALSEILNNLPEDLDNEYSMRLSILYAHFLPALSAAPKTPEQWVLKAAGVKDVRGYLNWAYSDGKRLMATDGHRLHIIPSLLPAGYYDRAMNQVEDKGTYPDVDRIIPNHAVLEYPAPVEPLNVAPITEGKPALRVEILPGVWVNKTYWDQATRGQRVTRLARVDKPLAAVRIDYEEGRLAIIMPIRVEPC